jgi:hypothetical protein
MTKLNFMQEEVHSSSSIIQTKKGFTSQYTQLLHRNIAPTSQREFTQKVDDRQLQPARLHIIPTPDHAIKLDRRPTAHNHY